SAPARRRNLSGAMRLTPAGSWRHPTAPSQAQWVMVVDDVVTTGSSLAESARVLTLGGHHSVAAVTIAATVARPEALTNAQRLALWQARTEGGGQD
ncbi:MAG: hypothetical protein LBV30_02900, partial [Propionibacteriaceae bacterium]|nr:hypothetical protein [Propionibacteriaceae bacterium]